jgi:hypothetical protein
LLNAAAAALVVREKPPPETDRRVLVATSTDFLAVGAGIAAAAGVRSMLAGWVTWVLAPFVAALVYVLVQAVEMAVELRRENGDEQ